MAAGLGEPLLEATVRGLLGTTADEGEGDGGWKYPTIVAPSWYGLFAGTAIRTSTYRTPGDGAAA